MPYYSLIQRFLLAFEDRELASFLQWHKDNQNNTDLTGPVDGQAWKHLRSTYPAKFDDPRSLLLGLAMDGVSPFRMSGHTSPYSVWPVIINTYNLPPWLATKPGYCWLVMILPGIVCISICK
jgi:hypothetical protein